MATTAISANAAVPTGSPSLLRDLWCRRLDTLISGIANKDTYYVQIANAAEHISAEYHGRFLIELLQNAEDGPPPGQVRALALMINACQQGLVLERIERGPTAEWKKARELFIRSALAATAHTRS